MDTFYALLAICAGNSPVPGEFPAQKPVTRSFDVFFDLRLNKRLSKQSWGWWFETLPRPLWRHCNVTPLVRASKTTIVQKRSCLFLICQKTRTKRGIPKVIYRITQGITQGDPTDHIYIWAKCKHILGIYGFQTKHIIHFTNKSPSLPKYMSIWSLW